MADSQRTTILVCVHGDKGKCPDPERDEWRYRLCHIEFSATIVQLNLRKIIHGSNSNESQFYS